MIHFILMFSRNGRIRLQKWFVAHTDRNRKKYIREVMAIVSARKQRACNFVEWREQKLVYRRYCGLLMVSAIEPTDNELIAVEMMHRYIELLDIYFGSVCELDVIFNFEKAYFVLDEFLIAGEIQEPNRKLVIGAVNGADGLQLTEINASESSLLPF